MPYVLRIITPKLRCVTLELLTPLERARFRALVQTLLSCGLNYVKSRQAGNNIINGQPGVLESLIDCTP